MEVVIKYLFVLLLLVGCQKKGSVYVHNRSVCVKSHLEQYSCMRYDYLLEMYLPSTCTRSVCDKYKCYKEKYIAKGMFKRDKLLSRKEVQCNVR